MNRREKLRENYEEALFALLLEEKIEEDGKSLLEEKARMNSDSGEEVPEQVNKRGYKTIRRAFAKENFRLISKTVGQTIQRLSVVVFLVVTLVSTAFAISPKFRVDTLNLLIEVSDVATSLRLTSEKAPSGSTVSNKPDEAGVTLMGYCFPNLPDGFELLHESVSDTSATVIYANEEGQEVWFSVDTANGNTLNIDTEDADLVETISVSGFQGLLVEKTYKFPDGEREQVTVVWGDIVHNYFVDVTTIGLGRSEALTLAEQVYYQDTPEGKENSSELIVPNEAGVNLLGYRLPKLSDSYTLQYENITDTYGMLMYQDPEGTEIRFSISFAEGQTLSVDTENAQNVETVVINGYEGILVEKPRMIEGELKERVLITLGDTDQNYFVNITTTGLGKEAAINLAEQVVYVGGGTTVVKGDGGELAVPNEAGVNLLGYQLPKLSDNYTLQYENITDTYGMLMYQDPEGTEIRFSISFAEGKTLTVDTENAQNVETVVINGYEGILVEKPRMIEGELKERVLITLGDTDQNYFVNITTTGLEKEAAIKLAEQVVYVGKASLK